jgi:hypothetical protein
MPATTAEPTATNTAATIDRAWIAAEFSKGIEAEREMAREARLRSEGPPEPALGVLYGQIADADERHRDAVTTIAIRYGHTPAHGLADGIGEAIGHLKDKVATIGATPLERLGHDLAAKANAIHWYNAWEQAFQSVGDSESARELAAILTEEKAHRDALQQVLDRLVEQGARGAHAAK